MQYLYNICIYIHINIWYMSFLMILFLATATSFLGFFGEPKRSRGKTSSTFGHPIAERTSDADVDCGAEG